MTHPKESPVDRGYFASYNSVQPRYQSASIIQPIDMIDSDIQDLLSQS